MQSFTQQLIDQIDRSDLSAYRISKRAHELAQRDGGPTLYQSELSRFRRGGAGMSCRKLNRLGEILQLTIRSRKTKKARS